MKSKVILLALLVTLLLAAYFVPVHTAQGELNTAELPERLPAFAEVSLPAGVDRVFYLQSQSLWGRERTVIAAPYIKAQLPPVGTAGSTDWSFFLDCPLWLWDGKVLREAQSEVTNSALEITADPNTAFTAHGGFTSHITLVPGPHPEGGWTAAASVSTLDSAQSVNTPATAHCTWQAQCKLPIPFAPTLPITAQAQGEYQTNVRK